MYSYSVEEVNMQRCEWELSWLSTDNRTTSITIILFALLPAHLVSLGRPHIKGDLSTPLSYSIEIIHGVFKRLILFLPLSIFLSIVPFKSFIDGTNWIVFWCDPFIFGCNELLEKKIHRSKITSRWLQELFARWLPMAYVRTGTDQYNATPGKIYFAER